MAEEDELRDSEAVEKVRETSGSRMIIGEILLGGACHSYSAKKVGM